MKSEKNYNIDEFIKSSIIELKNDGLTVAEIAERLGTTQRTLFRWLDKFSIDIKKQHKTIAKFRFRKRYFYVCTSGTNPNSTIAINTFYIITENSLHPTVESILNESNERFVNQSNLRIVSISEFNEDDWFHFISKQ
jgi:hypothetical protein